jgi:hypothetical protein
VAGRNEGEMSEYLHFGITAWLVVTVAIIARMDISSWDETLMSCGLAICWPVTAPFAAILYMSLAVFESAKKIKRRIKDKGLEREFYAWLDARDKGVILPKDSEE